MLSMEKWQGREVSCLPSKVLVAFSAAPAFDKGRVTFHCVNIQYKTAGQVFRVRKLLYKYKILFIYWLMFYGLQMYLYVLSGEQTTEMRKEL